MSQSKIIFGITMNFSPELWEQLFDFDLWAYVSSFFILVCCNGVRVSGYLPSKVSFCLLGCSHIPLESLLDNCIPRKSILSPVCSDWRLAEPHGGLLIGSALPGRGKSRVVNLGCHCHLSLYELLRIVSCQTEFAAGCTFYCLQFLFMCA